jgi:hypothetical protein
MKKSEFKKIIKPIVSECIKESLMEDGLIAGIIAEVVKGMTTASPSAPATQPAPPPDPMVTRMRNNALGGKKSSKLEEHRKKLMSAIGAGAYNGIDLFEGTTPVPAQSNPQTQASPLSGQASGDPGVDISSLFGAVGNHWGAHMTDVKEGKK